MPKTIVSKGGTAAYRPVPRPPPVPGAEVSVSNWYLFFNETPVVDSSFVVFFWYLLYFSFALTQKNQSAAADKAVIPLAKNEFRFAQLNELPSPLAPVKQYLVAASPTLHFIHFLNASELMPVKKSVISCDRKEKLPFKELLLRVGRQNARSDRVCLDFFGYFFYQEKK